MSPHTFTEAPEPESTSRGGTWAAIVLLGLIVAGVGGFFVNRTLNQIDQLNAQIDTLETSVQRTTEDADAATERAVEAERAARISAESREQAEENAELARQQAVDADQRAGVADQRATVAEEMSAQAQEEARLAREQAEEIRRVAEAETNRLTAALGRIAETRRTALGLVMSLDEEYLKFDFDEAELQPKSREVLSQIAGILFTADEFAITISGHTDARGTEEYNQELSERRAQAVADYLIGAGLTADLFTVQGLGKSQLLDSGTSAEAHTKNRRVELGMVNARIIH
jgi:outer membrane protein OmpA-like peptidoglycan-associated protein